MPTGLRPGVLRRAGKIDDALPEVDVRTGTLSARLQKLPGPKRQKIVAQLDQLDGDTKRYLADTDLDAPTTKTARLLETSGPAGRRVLQALADTDSDAADALLAMDDPATQRRFVRAYDSGDHPF